MHFFVHDSFGSPHFSSSVETPQDTKKQWMLTIPSNKSLQLTFDTVFELSAMSYIQVMRYNMTFLNITGELDMFLVCVKFITILFACDDFMKN